MIGCPVSIFNSLQISIMRIEVGILVNEIVFPLPSRNSVTSGSLSSKYSSGRSSSPSPSTSWAYLEISLFGHIVRTRTYEIVSSVSPILPCEKLDFRKDFIFASIADLLHCLKREPVLVRLWADHSDIHHNHTAQSSTRMATGTSRSSYLSNSNRQLLAECTDNAFNLFYPYHSLHPSYDHVTRRLHLNSEEHETRPILARLTLSVLITEDETNLPPQQTKSSIHVGASSSSDGRSQKRIPRAAYMEPTFSSMMSEHATRQQHFDTPMNSTSTMAMRRSASAYSTRNGF